MPIENPVRVPSLFTGADMQTVVAVIFTIVFIWWAIYTIVIAYHWFRYGRSGWLAVPAMAAHLFVSGWILIFITSGLR